MDCQFQLSEHRVNVFITYEHPDAPPLRTTFSDLADEPENLDRFDDERDRSKPKAAGNWLPENLRTAATGRYASEPLFVDVDAPSSDDFYLPIHKMLGGGAPSLSTLHSLSDRALSLLNEGKLYEQEVMAEDRFGHRLALAFGQAQVRRLESSMASGEALPGIGLAESVKKMEPIQFLPVWFDEVLVHAFATGRVVCRLSLRLDPRQLIGMEVRSTTPRSISPTLLTEVIDHIGRFAQLAWVQTLDHTAKDFRRPAGESDKIDERSPVTPKILVPPEFTVGSLLARLLFGGRAHYQPSYRSFTHAFGMVDGKSGASTKSELIDLGSRLARQYTSDYAVSSDVQHAHEVASFDNVVHLASREGSATIVDPRTQGRDVIHLQGYYETSLRPVYLPLIALNLHQLSHALSLNAETVLELGNPTKGTLSEWEEVRAQQVKLRNHFSFHEVSQVSLHNDWNSALRNVFNLDVAEARLGEDIAEMSERIAATERQEAAKRDQRHHRLFGWVPGLAAALGATLVISEGLLVYHSFAQDGFDAFETRAWWFLVVFFVLAVGWSFWRWIARR